MPIMSRILLIVALASIIAGCGGSGGGAGGATSTPGGSGVLGSRGVPGGTVTVEQESPGPAGAGSRFRLTLGSGLNPTQVTAWIGTADLPSDAGTQALPVADQAGAYEAAMAAPSPLPAGSHVWVRLSFADGSIIETGAEDFPLTTP